MPRRGRRHRVRRHKRRGLPHSRKQLVSLVKSIAYSTQETKCFQTDYDPFTITSGTTRNFQLALSLWADTPNTLNPGLISDYGWIGEKIYVKGVKYRFGLQTNDDVSMNWRFTLISTAHTEDMPNPFGGTTTLAWYDQSSYNLAQPPTHRRFNTQRVRVLKTRMVSTNVHGLNNKYTQVSLWYPFGRMITRAGEETAVADTWGTNKGLDYWLLIDGYNADNIAITAQNSITIEKLVYFKDA